MKRLQPQRWVVAGLGVCFNCRKLRSLNGVGLCRRCERL